MPSTSRKILGTTTSNLGAPSTWIFCSRIASAFSACEYLSGLEDKCFDLRRALNVYESWRTEKMPLLCNLALSALLILESRLRSSRSSATSRQRARNLHSPQCLFRTGGGGSSLACC